MNVTEHARSLAASAAGAADLRHEACAFTNPQEARLFVHLVVTMGTEPGWIRMKAIEWALSAPRFLKVEESARRMGTRPTRTRRPRGADL